MGQVADFLRAWRAEIAGYGIAQPFETMDLTIIDRLEARLPGCQVARALTESLDAKAGALRGITDYDEWLPVYEEYAEAKVGSRLLDTGLPVERIVPPRGQKRPDFRIRIGGQDYFVEVKTLHARGGVSGYRRSMEDGLDTLAELDLRRGTRPVLTGETVIQPHRQTGDDGHDPNSNKQIIETLIGRAVSHVKPGQFNQGPTIFALELSLLPLRAGVKEEMRRAYPDPHEGVATSGILWHLAFGEDGSDIFRPVDFRGASNSDGQLEAAGIMQGAHRDYVRGMWIISGGHTGWLSRSAHEAVIAPLSAALPGSFNNELNEAWCRDALTAQEVDELREMVRIKAYELWDGRNSAGTDGTPLTDWLAAKTALGIPHCAPV